MKIHLIDGTYELFRAYFAVPPTKAPNGLEVGAVRGLIRTLLALLRQGDVSHLGFAFDHVVESFRNDMFAGYKTGQGTPEELMGQFPMAERAASALGLVVWPMIEFEADDALATAANRWKDAPDVNQVVICSPDKDLAQVVQDRKVVCLDRRRQVTLDQDGVWGKFGVSPESIPDYLGLVGDAADGIPGIPKWGAKTSGRMLERYTHIEAIPEDPSSWDVELRGAAAISASLEEYRGDALFYRELATLRLDVDLPQSLEDLEWHGVQRREFQALCAELGAADMGVRDNEWRTGT